MKYNLQDRSLVFSKNIYKALGPLTNDELTSYAQQLRRSSSSIGANYAEATGAHSKKDFSAKISICKREAQETLYWLQLIEDIQDGVDFKSLIDECHQLVKIFHTIHKNSRA